MPASQKARASVPTDWCTRRGEGIGESGKSWHGTKPGNPTRGGVLISRIEGRREETGELTTLGLRCSRGTDVTSANNCWGVETLSLKRPVCRPKGRSGDAAALKSASWDT